MRIPSILNDIPNPLKKVDFKFLKGKNSKSSKVSTLNRSSSSVTLKMNKLQSSGGLFWKTDKDWFFKNKIKRIAENIRDRKYIVKSSGPSEYKKPELYSELQETKLPSVYDESQISNKGSEAERSPPPSPLAYSNAEKHFIDENQQGYERSSPFKPPIRQNSKDSLTKIIEQGIEEKYSYSLF